MRMVSQTTTITTVYLRGDEKFITHRIKRVDGELKRVPIKTNGVRKSAKKRKVKNAKLA